MDALISRILKEQEDYPATVDEFAKLLSQNGILLDSIRDPWGTPYRAKVETNSANRQITMTSAGPDKQFDTEDDFQIASFSGTYFRRESARIESALAAAPHPPSNEDEFRAALAKAGIDVASYRDVWGHPYHLVSRISFRYSDRTSFKTAREFGGVQTTKTEIKPVTQQSLIVSLRSDGPDGLRNTYDDFTIAHFDFVLSEESTKTDTQTTAQPNAARPGTGSISGTVNDVTGSPVPNAVLTLIDTANHTFQTVTDSSGYFSFAGIPVGVYSIRANVPGFMSSEISRVPVAAEKTTNLDVQLNVGTVAQTIEVSALALPLQTTSAATSSSQSSTPHIRDYFPETLVWLPEMVSGSKGRASYRFTLADSVTTWKVAAFASTLDGRSAEAETEFRSFQPFFIDFNPPLVMTRGDQLELPVTVRNYQDHAQTVAVTFQPNEWSKVINQSSKQVNIPSGGSLNVPFVVEANSAVEKGPQRVIATSPRAKDAIEKTSRVHPDGQEVVQTFADFVTGSAEFNVSIPPAAIANATRGELRLYPNVASLLWESSSAILAAPHGCAEQTISAGYANLVALKFAHTSGIATPVIETRARTNIRQAVDSLQGFTNSSGGVGYWNSEQPDIAVTAYALSFLANESVVSPDSTLLRNLVSYLEKSQSADGRWLPRHSYETSAQQALLLTSTVTRALAEAQKAGAKVSPNILAGAYHQLAQFIDHTDEPYLLANFLLSVLDAGDDSLLADAPSRLLAMAHAERGGIYWDMQSNSPFYGWGTAGRYETTGLVVSALAAWRTKHPASPDLDSAIRRALVFLLRGRDSSGWWSSTQATLRAMRAIADASTTLGNITSQGNSIEIRSNGRVVKTILMPTDPKATDPLIVDMSSFLPPGDDKISLAASGAIGGLLLRLTASHWLPWAQTEPRNSGELRFSVQFDKLDPAPGQPVRCTVNAERVGFRGYGMIMAEIGLPPGAEVDRSSIESLLEDNSLAVDHYDVLPDRVVFYLWPKAGGSKFEFLLTARNAMNAKSEASRLYDYYNPEALSEVPPYRWTVKWP